MSSEYDLSQELGDLSNKVNSLSPDVELLVCVPMMVRFKVCRSKAKQMDVCFQFPTDYPESLAVFELKSKTLPLKFFHSVHQMVDKEKEQFIGRAHIMPLLRFIIDYLDANPLCVCVEEISKLKKLVDLSSENTKDFFKIKQKQSLVHFRSQKENYYLEAKITIPQDYPQSRVSCQIVDSNFPQLFEVFMEAQAAEIARKCVQPPLFKGKPGQKKPPKPVAFEPKLSLEPVGRFMIENSKFYPTETCGLCKKVCFPDKPEDAVNDETKDDSVERVYCNHIFHHGCLDPFMKTPPFTGGKKCPRCQSVIFHEKWKVSEKTREERWAHQQAKERELEEVEDFLN